LSLGLLSIVKSSYRNKLFKNGATAIFALMPNASNKYVLLTGSDLGNREGNLELALELISENIGDVLQTSEVMESEPWGFESDTRFLNQAILVKTVLQPQALLQKILKIEQEIGRVRKETQWVSRVIDIDILCTKQLIHHTDELTVPHKHLHNRSFALAPLCQLAPTWTHPLLKKTYHQLLLEVTESKNAHATQK